MGIPEALINDINADLIALYSCIQAEGDDFINYASTFFVAKNNTEDAFYTLRDAFNATNNPRKRAALLIYLNKHAFNGLIRYNSKGHYNVPFGKYKAPRFPHDEIQNFLKRTQQGKTCFTCRDFRDVFFDLKPGDVVYCDPPYVPLSDTANFTSYSGNVFNSKDQEDLAVLARKAFQKGVSVILSNHDTPHIRELYADAKIISFDVQRFISCKGNDRNKAPEILAVYKA